MRDRGIDYEANRPDPYLEDLTASDLFGAALGLGAFTLVAAVLVVWAAWKVLTWLPATTEIVP